MDPTLWAQAAGFLERRETFRADYQTFVGKVSAYELDPPAPAGLPRQLVPAGAQRGPGAGSRASPCRVFGASRGWAGPSTARRTSMPAPPCEAGLRIAGGEKPMKIRPLFEPKLAVYISERQWHPSHTLKKRPDGRVELRMRRKELVRSVLSWMPDVRVLAPKSLRDRITLKLTDGLRRNTENEDGPNNC